MKTTQTAKIAAQKNMMTLFLAGDWTGLLSAILSDTAFVDLDDRLIHHAMHLGNGGTRVEDAKHIVLCELEALGREIA